MFGIFATSNKVKLMFLCQGKEAVALNSYYQVNRVG